MTESRPLHVLVAGGGLAGLATAQGGEVELTDAIGTYEAQMREVAYPILRMTLDHDKNFGGGALAEAEAKAGSDT